MKKFDRRGKTVAVRGFIAAGIMAATTLTSGVGVAFADVPDAPTIGTATAGSSSAIVAFSAPTFTGGTISSYTVTWSTGTHSCDAPPATCEVTGLTPGTAYSFTVTATNGDGTSTASDSSNSVTPYTTPGAPTSVLATPGNGSATVSFGAPSSDGYNTIDSYTVTATDVTNSGDGGQTSTDTESPIVISGLTNGDSYTFTVTAHNAAGDGTPSSATTSIVPFTTPDAPTSVTATAGSSSASVSFTAPAFDGGRSIDSYTVTSDPGAYTCTTANGSTTTCEVTGLSAGTSYSFTVTALNFAGNGSASSPSNSVTPYTTPGAPTSVSATAGSSSASVAFTAPSSGGSTILSYTVTATDTTNAGNGGQTNSGTSSPISMSGLTPGDAYTFTVTANNAAGDGTESSPSSAVTPYTMPNAPTNVVATAGNASALVTFSAPISDGGSAIDGYTITSSPGSVTCDVAYGDEAIGCTMTRLTNGENYTFTVTAHNAAGDSDASTPSDSILVATDPDQVSNLQAARGVNSVTLSWDAPASTGSNTITGYVASYDTVTVDCGTELSCVVSGLTTNASHTFTITAENDAGLTSTATISSSRAQNPSAVTAFDVQPLNGAVELTWEAPTSSGTEDPDMTYVITVNTSVVPALSRDCTAGPTDCIVSGLTNGTVYTFQVTAVNSAGLTTASSTFNHAPAVNPVAINGSTLSITGGAGQAPLSWTALTTLQSGGSGVADYTVTAVPTSITGDTVTKACGNVTTCTVTGLLAGAVYDFTVVATNNEDLSGPETTKEGSVLPAAPSNPVVVNTASDGQGAFIQFTPSGPSGGTGIDGYLVSALVSGSPSGITCTALPKANSCKVKGLTPGTTYTFSVKAHSLYNTNGYSNAVATSPVLVAARPSTPSFTSLVRTGSGAITVHFANSTYAGGTPVLSYKITTKDATRSCTYVVGTDTGNACTISGLTNGSPVSFRITASNVLWTSTLSPKSESIIPGASASAPQSVQVLGRAQGLTVKWTKPASNGGLKIAGYVAETSGAHSCTVSGSSATTCTIGGLTPGQSYEVTVHSYAAGSDSAATGASSVGVSGTVPTVASAPTSAAASVGTKTGSIVISWSVPDSNGGAAIDSFTATAVGAPLVTCSYAIPASGTPANTCVVKGLAHADSYSFTVTAHNVAGTSAVSNTTASVHPKS